MTLVTMPAPHWRGAKLRAFTPVACALSASAVLVGPPQAWAHAVIGEGDSLGGANGAGA